MKVMEVNGRHYAKGNYGWHETTASSWFPIAGVPLAQRALLDEIEQLRAIVDKLPRTADGVVVVPGMDLYKRSSKWPDGLWAVRCRPRVDAIEANGIVRRHGHESGWLERASDLYASRSAATGEEEQAVEPQPDSPKPTCETCRFWWGRKIDGCGDCQRFPPTHDQDGLGVFPLNYAESWCGEHQPREDK